MHKHGMLKWPRMPIYSYNAHAARGTLRHASTILSGASLAHLQAKGQYSYWVRGILLKALLARTQWKEHYASSNNALGGFPGSLHAGGFPFTALQIAGKDIMAPLS